MSSIKEVLGFEKFNLKDIWSKIKKDPKRMFLGAVDPWSTKVWNHTGVGKDWEPLVDQMGGAYGGSTLTMGDTGEGVYGRAREAGVPTEAGAGMHDIAHVIASMYAGGYGADKLGAAGKFMPRGGFNLGGGGTPQPSQSRMAYRQPPQQPLVAPGVGAVNSRRSPMSKNQLMAEMLMRRV